MKKVFTGLFLAMTSFVFANNIQVSNVSVSQPNISFTISWDNSWNTMNNINPLYPNNWDGAWVFIKYQNPIDNLWKHATVSSVVSDHTISGGILQIETTTDGMGVFIRRTNPGNGNIGATTVTLKMNSLIGTGLFNFKVFGTEVVYIPQSDFQLGDGNVSGSTYFTPQTITAAIQSAGLAANALYSTSPALPAAFPMGYNSYYMMKYEITNEQYVDFVNTLNYDQQVNRIDFAPNSAVNSRAFFNNNTTMVDDVIKIQAPGLNNTAPATLGCDLNGNNLYNEAADGQNIAAGMLSKADIFAYLDWSGLRPMTEMEFEKACRGTQARVINEYAWGSTAIAIRTRITAGFINSGLPTESWNGPVVNGQTTAATISTLGGSTTGPTRVGMYATNSTGRASAGAGFYGNMDLSGNVWEYAVGIDAGGIVFNGLNGNGQVSILGEADVTNWPGGSTAAAGSGTTVKGGSYNETSTVYLTTSYRNGGAGPGRSITIGGRGVRTAP